MNLYEVVADTRVGRTNSTHFKNTVTLHVSAQSLEGAARKAPRRAERWARKEHSYIVKLDPTAPVCVAVTQIRLIDEDWQ